MSAHITTHTPIDVLLARRSAVFDRLGEGVMVLPAAAEQNSSRDTERPYVPDRELFYLTGLTEPEAVAVLVGGSEPRTEIFVRDRNAEAELWAGPRMGPDIAGVQSGADEAHARSALTTRLPELLSNADRVHYRLGRRGAVERMVFGALAHARARGQRHGTGPRAVVDPGEILDELRLRKDAHEIECIRRACAVTVDGHVAAAAAVREGVGEWAIEAALEAAFRRGGATRPGFESIVGSGANACVLHYVANEATVPEGGLVLIDAGAEVGLYHGDVTRTLPASGRFTEAQRDIYNLVDAARAASIAVVRPGVSFSQVHEAAVRTLTEGLVDLGVLDGAVDDLMERGAHRDFFPHQTSHWLGLDVHDPGDYARAGTSRLLEPGMVFTVEPGLYFQPESPHEQAAAWAGIGVRIEDDVLVTESGVEVLTTGFSTSDVDVEARVGG